MINKLLFSVSAICLLFMNNSYCQDDNDIEGKNLFITGSKFSVDIASGKIIYEGNVTCESGTITIQSDKVTALFNNENSNEVTNAEAQGKVFIVSDKFKAKCKKAIYTKEGEKEVIVLLEDVEILQPFGNGMQLLTKAQKLTLTKTTDDNGKVNWNPVAEEYNGIMPSNRVYNKNNKIELKNPRDEVKKQE